METTAVPSTCTTCTKQSEQRNQGRQRHSQLTLGGDGDGVDGLLCGHDRNRQPSAVLQFLPLLQAHTAVLQPANPSEGHIRLGARDGHVEDATHRCDRRALESQGRGVSFFFFAFLFFFLGVHGGWSGPGCAQLSNAYLLTHRAARILPTGRSRQAITILSTALSFLTLWGPRSSAIYICLVAVSDSISWRRSLLEYGCI